MKKQKEKSLKTEALRCAIYARFSSAMQREESIEGQLRECHAYAERQGWIVVEEYCDRAMSGTNVNRPGFQKMMADSENDVFDVVLTWKHDRFSRSRYDAAVYRKKLKDKGIKIAYAVEPTSDDPTGILMDSLLDGFAEFYSANLAENVKRGLYDAALHRKFLGKPQFGFKKDPVTERYAINEDEAVVVRHVFEAYANGEPIFKILEYINSQGFRTCRGNPFGKDQVARMIANEKYKGVYSYEDIYDEEGIPPIVSKELWEKANNVRGVKKKVYNIGVPEGEYFLLGKLFDQYNQPMKVSTGTSKSGKVFRYYKSSYTVGKEIVERKVIRALAEIACSDEIVSLFTKEIMRQQNERRAASPMASIEAELSEVNKKIGNLAKAVAEGVDSSIFTDMIKDLTKQKDGLERRLVIVKHEEGLILTPEMVEFWFSQFRNGDTEDAEFSRFIIKMFLRRAWYKKDGTVVLQLNYPGDGSKVTLAPDDSIFDEGFDCSIDDFADMVEGSQCSTNARSSPLEVVQSNIAITFVDVRCFARFILNKE